MKKVYLLFGIMMSLLLIGVVKAEGPFNLEFETPRSTNMPGLNVGYKDGYIMVDYGYDNDDSKISTIFRYDSKGKELKQTKFVNKEIVALKAKDNDIYVLYYDFAEDVGDEPVPMYFARLDENLSVKKTVSAPAGYYSVYFNYKYRYGIDLLYITDTGISILFPEDVLYVRTYTRDLSSYDDKELNKNEAMDEYPALKIFDLRNKIVSGKIYPQIISDYANNKYAVAHFERRECDDGDYGKAEKICFNTIVGLYDSEGNKIWSKTLSRDYQSVTEIRIIDNYVAAIAYKEDSSDILIYDMKGNLVQTIKSTSYQAEIIDTEKGFVVIQSSCELGMVRGISASYGNDVVNASQITAKASLPQVEVAYQPSGFDPCCYVAGATAIFGPSALEKSEGHTCYSNHQVYYLYRKIEHKVTQGKGKIQVINQQKPGEPVEFIITPDEGYVLGKVKVTDANGKTVVFTQNRFTMPSADVTIEVEFLVANAKTADIAIIGISIIAIIAAGIVFTQYRKIKEA